jgi:hypothetical protein
LRHLARILAAYAELDAALEQERSRAANSVQIEERQILNDQAYFLLCWGQLENEINVSCREAIRRRRSDLDWHVRRGWDLYNPEEPRLSGLSFENRVKLVLDARAGRGSPLARAMAHYEMRNRVAYGQLETRRVNVAAIVAEFHLVQAALHRSA